MENNQQEEEDNNQNTSDQYSTSLLFPSLEIQSHSTFFTTHYRDTCFPFSKEVQPIIFQVETQMASQKRTIKNVRKNSKKIRRKTQRNKNTKIIINPLLKQIQDLIIQVNYDPPFKQIQVLKKMRSLIETLDNLLGNMKQQLLIQTQVSDSSINSQ